MSASAYEDFIDLVDICLACCYAPQAKIKRKKLGSKVDRVLDRMSEKRKHSRKARDGDGDDGEYGTTDRLRDDDDRPMV